MKVYVAAVGIMKEGLSPIGVYSKHHVAVAAAEKACNPDFQAWDVYEFELDAPADSGGAAPENKP